MPQKAYHEANRKSWNLATDAHNSHKRDQAGFLRNGGSTLFPEEIELLGDLTGKSLAHLQCNAGQDTLSLARLGAAVTGVDISDTAIDFARQLSIDSGIPGTFHRSDLYDWLETTGERFDIAFTSYGVLTWLSDLKAWGRGITRILKPGGRFVMVEFHPTYNIFEDDWQIIMPNMGGAMAPMEGGIGDYVAMSGEAGAPSGYETGVENFQNPHPVYEFGWGTGDIVTTLLDAGLQLTALREYPYSNGFKRFPDMREIPGNRFAMPEGKVDIPLMLGVTALKPA
jgi:SAM-dependent methyltransferase